MSAPQSGREHGDSGGSAAKQPSIVPGASLLGIAAVLIIVVLLKPDMPQWLKITIVVVVIFVVLALLGYSVYLFRVATKRGGRL